MASDKGNIDIVVTWVDGNDPAWIKEKNKYKKTVAGDSRNTRYRDWENLKYWFRGIEKFVPWYNNLFFVTQGHLPKWLNTENKKLRIVKHAEFIPDEYLPTFSCRPIELNLHRIKGLSERFVYFNDDMFVLKDVKSTDFFKDGLPCDSAILNAMVVNGKGRDGERLAVESMYTTNIFNTAVINRNFKKSDVIRNNWRKWFSPNYGFTMGRTFLLLPWSGFTGFLNPHLPYSYLKSTYDDIWRLEESALRRACSNKFRDPLDISSRVLSYWQIAKGTFSPRSPKIGKSFVLSNNETKNEALFSAIRNQKYKLICANDGFSGDNFDDVKDRLNKAFEAVFPNKSGFEL